MRCRAFKTQRSFADGFRNRIHGRQQLRRRWLLLLLRRHLALIELVKNLLPRQGIVGSLDAGRKAVEAPITLLLIRTVAFDAVVVQKIFAQRSGDAERRDDDHGRKRHAADHAVIRT